MVVTVKIILSQEPLRAVGSGESTPDEPGVAEMTIFSSSSAEIVSSVTLSGLTGPHTDLACAPADQPFVAAAPAALDAAAGVSVSAGLPSPLPRSSLIPSQPSVGSLP